LSTNVDQHKEKQNSYLLLYDCCIDSSLQIITPALFVFHHFHNRYYKKDRYKSYQKVKCQLKTLSHVGRFHHLVYITNYTPYFHKLFENRLPLYEKEDSCFAKLLLAVWGDIPGIYPGYFYFWESIYF
jgi:hypothetical protein